MRNPSCPNTQAREGSSPRLRGTLRTGRERARTDGIIPALAGNTIAIVCSCRRSWDHPRACGEHYTYDSADINSMGSSPRLRGTLGFPCEVLGEFGIIPALAGNTAAPAARLQCAWDHPRACGEHLRPDSVTASVTGSSPRLRGTHYFTTGNLFHIGIIPALAGNTRRGQRQG